MFETGTILRFDLSLLVGWMAVISFVGHFIGQPGNWRYFYTFGADTRETWIIRIHWHTQLK